MPLATVSLSVCLLLLPPQLIIFFGFSTWTSNIAFIPHLIWIPYKSLNGCVCTQIIVEHIIRSFFGSSPDIYLSFLVLKYNCCEQPLIYIWSFTHSHTDRYTDKYLLSLIQPGAVWKSKDALQYTHYPYKISFKCISSSHFYIIWYTWVSKIINIYLSDTNNGTIWLLRTLFGTSYSLSTFVCLYHTCQLKDNKPLGPLNPSNSPTQPHLSQIYHPANYFYVY